MITDKERKNVEMMISDILGFSDSVKEEIIRKITEQEMKMILLDTRIEVIEVLLQELTDIEEYELCELVKKASQDR